MLFGGIININSLRNFGRASLIVYKHGKIPPDEDASFSATGSQTIGRTPENSLYTKTWERVEYS